MRSVFTLGAAAFLAACSMSSTPVGGDCTTRANTELMALKSAIEAAETNLARGYAIERRIDEATGTTIEAHAPINRAEEQAKLASLNARLPDVQARAAAAVAQCG